MNAQDRDEHFLRKCLVEAVKGLGWAPPNPLVGCVIVKDGAIVSRGAHLKDGTAHAEQAAIGACPVELLNGAELYVNLEPCSHQGRTPPCTAKIIEAGISRVVWGENDSDPRSAGKARAILESAGIETKSGVLYEECRKLNRVFHFRQRGGATPYVAAKLAISADGKIAAHPGERTVISCRASRGLAHIFRQHFDAVLAGANTIAADNPLLTVREEEITAFRESQANLGGTFAGLVSSGKFERNRDPIAVLLDGNLRASPEMKVFNETRNCRADKSVLLIVRPENYERRQAEFAHIDFVEVVPVKHQYGKADWREILSALYEREIYSLLVEGGAAVLESLMESGEYGLTGNPAEGGRRAFPHSIHIFESPIIIGEEGVGVSPIFADSKAAESFFGENAVKGQIDGDGYWEILFGY